MPLTKHDAVGRCLLDRGMCLNQQRSNVMDELDRKLTGLTRWLPCGPTGRLAVAPSKTTFLPPEVALTYSDGHRFQSRYTYVKVN